jgi:hypothetical protein
MEGFHIFVSYRWLESDSWVADAIFLHASKRSVRGGPARAFLDRVMLQSCPDTVAGFTGAVLASRAAMPVVSAGALEGMARLEAGSYLDHLLLEWTLILELLHAGALVACLPVLLLDAPDDWRSDAALRRLPDVVCSAVAAAAAGALEARGLTPSAGLGARTVRETVRGLVALGGVTLTVHVPGRPGAEEEEAAAARGPWDVGMEAVRDGVDRILAQLDGGAEAS